ncbi:MAG: outer membrane beta-barrel protein, partial [Bacteroidota bacterium]
MKKLPFLLLLGIMVSFTCSYGQLGVKAGASTSAAGSYGNSEEGESIELKLGYQVGVFYIHELTDKIGLMAELNFESKGTVSKKDYNISLPVQDPNSGMVLGIGNYAVNQEIRSSLNYLNLPILV